MSYERSTTNFETTPVPAIPAQANASSIDVPRDIKMWLQQICPAKSLIQRSRIRHSDLRQKRKQEFHAGRILTSKLLASFGEFRSVGVNEDRSPDWPEGYVGSISHSNRWVWAAVAENANVRSMGIDTESVVDVETRKQIKSQIATAAEWDIANSLDLDIQQAFSVVFSAKESFYKCCYPLTQNYFSFEHAAVEDVASDRIRIRTLESNPNFGIGPKSLDVFYLCLGSDVFTTTWMEQGEQ